MIVKSKRSSVAAGSFYPSEKDELKKFIKKTLGKRENILACVVPHAGYVFSGKLAGNVLSKFREKKDFILLGVNHSGIGNKISFSLEDFETVLGVVKNNRALSNKIIRNMKKEKLDVDVNGVAHENEHSLEVELPFLQVIQKKFEIVPVLLKDMSYDECVKVAKILSEYVDENVGLIVSSDFTHFGVSYGFIEFKNVNEVKDYDSEVITEILNKNSDRVYEKASKSTICGLYGLTIITELAKLKNWKARKVDYYTSYDVTGDKNIVVGYGGVVFQ